MEMVIVPIIVFQIYGRQTIVSNVGIEDFTRTTRRDGVGFIEAGGN
jgi:hypothetical protein